MFNKCVICLCSIKKNKKILECGHHFHNKCIMQLLELDEGEKKTCPICRDHIEHSFHKNIDIIDKTYLKYD